MTHVSIVTSILRLGFLKRNPPLVHVLASGLVRSSGWTNGRLEARVYAAPPVDGIQDLAFVADKPSGNTLPVLTPVLGEGLFERARWMRGVRIHAEINVLERLFAPVAAPLFSHDLSEDQEPGEPIESPVADLAASHLPIGGPQSGEGEALVVEEMVGVPLVPYAADKRCYDYTLLSISGWPETKTEWEMKCVVKIGGKCRVKTKVPVPYHRTSELKFIATVCLPTEQDVEDAVKECLRDAIAAGVIAGIATGSPAAAAAALTAFLKTCLAAKGVSSAKDVHVDVHERKVPGPWKRI